MRVSVLALLALLVLLVQVVQGRSPNIVIFYADDMGIGDLGCYGCTDIQTPNLDALARSGLRFTNYYSAAPLCSPSRAALLTGRYPARAGVPSNVSSDPGVPGMPGEEVTIAEVAKQRGYATALVGKWHLGFSPDTVPNAQGFDFFFGHHCGCIDYYSHMFYWSEPYHHDLYRNHEEIHEEGQYMTDLIVRESLGFIDQHSDRPFLLYVPFNAPHYPLQAPERFRQMYAHLPRQRADYAPLVAGMDEAVGKIMAGLGRHNLLEQTLVFFASDNGVSMEGRANGGGGSSGPFRGEKFSMFEGGIRMPAMISWPGTIPQNQTRDQLVIAMDVFVTVAEAMGAQLPAGRVIDGQSWMPIFRDAQAPGHETLFWAWHTQQAVRQGKWKVVRDTGVERGKSRSKPAEAGGTVFLADLEADPGETANLRRQHPEIADRLLKLNDAWRASLEQE